MRIKKLEMFGFKSFADRTSFLFGNGISCVVGPNGCGKSNVVDALRWCIGEQSAKSLRGGEMQDVIFAGSAHRKPVGYAEVMLTLSVDDDQPFPGEYARFSEVEVCRRLYRAGGSEYLINQARCRRRDIVDLFMDTGVGNNLYSFIEQGRIDKIVSASPEERRSLIDEAAGITKYKQRRAEARTKLEATGSQLDRAADVADEMGRRLKQLERQVVKAARFRRLRAKVRQGEVFLALAKYADQAEQLGGVQEEQSLHGREHADLEAEAERLGEEARDHAEALGIAEEVAGRARDELAELEAQRREHQAAVGFHRRRKEELDNRISAARVQLTEDAERRDSAVTEQAETASALEGIEGTLAYQERQVDTVRTLARTAELERERARATLADAQSEASTAGGEETLLAGRLADLRERAGELPGRIAQLDTQLQGVRQDGVVLAKRAEVASHVLLERRGAWDDARVAAQQAEAELADATRAEGSARSAARRGEAELDAAQNGLNHAMRDAERASGLADAAVAKAAEGAQRAEDGRLRQEEREAARVLGAFEAGERQQVQRAEGRARAWTAAFDEVGRKALQRWLAGEERALALGASNAEASRAAADRETAETLQAMENGLREEAATALRERIDARRDATNALKTARDRVTELDGQLAEAQRVRRGQEGRLTGLRAEERAARERDAGGRAVGEVLPDAPRLVDILSLGPDETEIAPRVLGDRLLMPVVQDPVDVGRAAEAAREAGATSLLFAPAGPLDLAAALDGLTIVDDLDAALAAHTRGTAVVARSTGERIDADGVVHLGMASEDAARALAVTREIETLTVEVAASGDVCDQLAVDILQARARIESAKVVHRKASEAVEEADRAGRERIRDALAAAREDAASAAATRRTELSREQERARAGLAAADKERRQGLSQQVIALREEADRTLVLLREQMAERVGLRRTEHEAAAEARLVASMERVQAAREAAVGNASTDRETRRARLADLVGASEAARRAMETARGLADAASSALDAVQATAGAAARTRAEHELIVVKMEAELRSVDEQRQSLAQRETTLEAELAALEVERRTTDAALAENAEALSQVADRAAAARAALNLASASVAASEAVAEERIEARRAAEQELAELRERRAGLRAQRAAAERAAAEASDRLEKGNAGLAELTLELEASREARMGAARVLDVASTATQQATVKNDAARARLKAVKDAWSAAHEALSAVSERRDSARDALMKAEQVAARIRFEVENLRERIDERYQISLPHALRELLETHALRLEVDDEVRAGLTIADRRVEPLDDMVIGPELLRDEEAIKACVATIGEERQQLERIGEVNLTALGEYEALAERHGDLDGQREDLEASVASIREAIATMNTTCRERFREAFDKVDQTFRESYPALVGGGEARLALTDEEDLLETGVEIFVRPPGKRLQNLGLLSGGEKAMTAIALLLALFTVKPSPFCVLDEVDAPLDEANGTRFNDMLRHMCRMTQFIVITHNRKTMECADTLYGVTMPTPGCSGLVSVQVD